MEGYYPLRAYYPLFEIVVVSFNAILFVLLSFLLLRARRERRPNWGGNLYPAIVIALAALFVSRLSHLFATSLRGGFVGLMFVPEMVSKFIIPPLVFHLFYREEAGFLPRRRALKTFLGALYAAAIVCAALGVNTCASGWRGGYPGWPAIILLGRILMTCGAVGTALVLLTSRRRLTGALEHGLRRGLVAGCALWAGAFLLGGLLPPDIASALEKVPPLVFIFVLTYYVERFTFFDVLIKKGAFVFASLLLLTLEFVFLAPLLLRLRFTNWMGSLAWALLVWPVVLLAPWGHRKLSAWLDRLWLGRHFSPAAATNYFLEGLGGITSERELAGRAATRLGTIFYSSVDISFAEMAEVQSAAGESMSAAIRLGERTLGHVCVHAREHSRRFLSEDLMLLESLAGGLAFLLENIRLREKRLEQEKRESELAANAQRSELKALRAQVNPHFLFNALNAIAALIPRQPARAEETVEQLAEVFRYALHRSEREWVRLDEELAAIEAYLRVEQARFGEALRFEISAEAAARNARIPAMMVQTLVENAVKHGVIATAAPGLVEVRAHAAGPLLRIDVRDSGPGFDESALRAPQRPGAGYGLRNVRDRLGGYFGGAARLSIGRDSSRNMTLVTIEMPLAAPASKAAL